MSQPIKLQQINLGDKVYYRNKYAGRIVLIEKGFYSFDYLVKIESTVYVGSCFCYNDVKDDKAWFSYRRSHQCKGDIDKVFVPGSYYSWFNSNNGIDIRKNIVLETE